MGIKAPIMVQKNTSVRVQEPSMFSDSASLTTNGGSDVTASSNDPALLKANKHFEKMMEFKLENEDRLQDNFEELLTKSSAIIPTEKV